MAALIFLFATVVALIGWGPENADPNRRMRELLHTSERTQPAEYEWGRGPAHGPVQMPPERVHGGIQ